MTLFEHPIFPYLLPYAHLSEGRDNLDFLQLPEQLRALALEVVTNCVSCGRVVHPMRARLKSTRSRIAGTEYEHRLFYAPTCPTEVDAGCSRTTAAQEHKDALRRAFGLAPRGSGAAADAIETYDALCLQEPWLELILLGHKTLETRTKCLRRTSGPVVLVSSKSVDETAWESAVLGRMLGDLGRERALRGLGKLAALVELSGFRPGVPGVDDGAACIVIDLGRGRVRHVAEVSGVRHLARVDTMRVRPDGSIVAGASQGFFRVPRSIVRPLDEVAA